LVEDIQSLYRTRVLSHDGKQRVLRVPISRLMRIQRGVYRELLRDIVLPSCVHSTKGRSVLTNARVHVRHAYVSVLDIEGCFPSIGPQRIKKALERTGFRGEVALLLSRLLTCDRELPQGAPASPTLVNLVLLDLDRKAESVARHCGLAYTRYVDDITLSGGRRTWDLARTIERILAGHKLNVKLKKRHDWGPSDRKTVTGILVNTKPNVLPEYREHVRTVLVNHRDGLIKLTGDELASIRGKIGFIKTVNPQAAAKLSALLPADRPQHVGRCHDSAACPSGERP
jgi:RNA-directed DNA polymerase